MRGISVVTKVGVVATVVSISVLSTGVARATPPSGGVQLKDLARAQAVESASVPIKPGTTLVSGAYTLAPGGETGWRRLPGAAVGATRIVRRAMLKILSADSYRNRRAAGVGEDRRW